MSTKVKICGLYRTEDIHMINEIIPDYIGFIINIPKSHRNVSISDVLKWRTILNPQIKSVGVFVNEPIENILEVANALNVIQLHGNETEEYLSNLREKSKIINDNLEFWKAFSVKTPEDIKNALEFPADKILLDYGKGEGKTFDWTILKTATKPFILAGGINPENVKEAINNYSPQIVDLSSGVETNQVKDKEKIKKLMKEMKL